MDSKSIDNNKLIDTLTDKEIREEINKIDPNFYCKSNIARKILIEILNELNSIKMKNSTTEIIEYMSDDDALVELGEKIAKKFIERQSIEKEIQQLREQRKQLEILKNNTTTPINNGLSGDITFATKYGDSPFIPKTIIDENDDEESKENVKKRATSNNKVASLKGKGIDKTSAPPIPPILKLKPKPVFPTTPTKSQSPTSLISTPTLRPRLRSIDASSKLNNTDDQVEKEKRINKTKKKVTIEENDHDQGVKEIIEKVKEKKEKRVRDGVKMKEQVENNIFNLNIDNAANLFNKINLGHKFIKLSSDINTQAHKEEFIKFIVLKVIDNDFNVKKASKLIAPPLIQKLWKEISVNEKEYKQFLKLVGEDVYYNKQDELDLVASEKSKELLVKYQRTRYLYESCFPGQNKLQNKLIWPTHLKN